MERREELARRVREGQRAARELERLDALPDLDAMAEGTILAVAMRFLRSASQAYTYVGFKTGNFWYFTGNGPNKATSEGVKAWMARSGWRVVDTRVVAEIELTSWRPVGVVNLEMPSTLLAEIREYPARSRDDGRLLPLCKLSDCGCIGVAHP